MNVYIIYYNKVMNLARWEHRQMFRDSNIIMWLSRREEKEILALCKTHLDKVVETVEEMKWVVHSFCNDDFNALEEHYKKSFDNERAADDIKHRILRDVSTGPLHPIDREEVIRLVLTADDIAENAKSGGRKLRFASTKCLTDQISASLREMADMCVEIARSVRVAFEKLSVGTDAAIESAAQVEILEESIDEFRMGLLKAILSCKQPVVSVRSLGPWLMLLNAIENMEDVADRSEDVADVIRTIAILR
jgi:predicted phosphate transport protein (TIGR00153 family)